MNKATYLVAVGLVLLLSISVAAASFEFYGGGSYNTFSPEALNDVVDACNDELESTSEVLSGKPKELDKIESGFGAFGGVRNWLNPTTALGGEAEYFGKKIEGSVAFTDWEYSPGKTANGSVDVSIDASVTGFSGSGAFKAGPALTVFASAGYYYLNGNAEQTLHVDSVSVEGTQNEAKGALDSLVGSGKIRFSDSALGFKAGAAFSYPVADQLSILGRAAYRNLTFKEVTLEADDGDGDYSESEWPIDASDPDKADLDFSGFELGLGIVYSF